MDSVGSREIAELDTRVDELFAIVKKEAPFYKNISTLISITALLFSFGTTFVSYYKSNAQETQTIRSDLLNTLQRLVTIPRENIAASIKYSGNVLAYSNISGNFNQENILLTKKADELIRKLPTSEVSSTDYLTISQAMFYSRNFSAALVDNKMAVKLANTEDDSVGALRSLANLQFVLGRYSEGREKYQEALEIWAQYTGYDDNVKSSVNFQTEMAWANSEAYVGKNDLAKLHLDNAEEIVSKMPLGTDENTKAILQQAKNYLFRAPNAAISAPPILSSTPVLTVPEPAKRY